MSCLGNREHINKQSKRNYMLLYLYICFVSQMKSYTDICQMQSKAEQALGPERKELCS